MSSAALSPRQFPSEARSPTIGNRPGESRKVGVDDQLAQSFRNTARTRIAMTKGTGKREKA